MQDIIKKGTSLKTQWRTVLFGLAGIFLFVYLITVAIAPLNKIKELAGVVEEGTVFTKKIDSIYFHTDMKDLLKEKAYKDALLKLSESDSIQLVVNLSDSTVNLYIKGVMIHQTKVGELKRDKLFDKMPLQQEIEIFSKPLAIGSQSATIVKEPIVVRQAPKDTLEATLNAWKPDTLIQNPAFAVFFLDYNFKLIFEQDKTVNSLDKRAKFKFHLQLKVKKFLETLGNFMLFKKQEYQPTITIKMPVEELRAIYRALPENTFVVLKF